MTFEEIYNKLIILEEEIEDCYIKLIECEIDGNEADYDYFLALIDQDVRRELDYYKILEVLDYYGDLVEKVNKELIDSNEFIISLGRNSKAIYYRLKYFIEAASYDDNLCYITTLRTDRTKITLAMLNKMLNNPTFSSINDELIWYKYNLFYLNPYIENDFLYDNSFNTLLESDCYRIPEFPSSVYLDKAELVLPSINALDYVIANSQGNFKENKTIFTYITIKLLTIISSMTLCTEDNINLVLYTINDILESPEYSLDLRNILQEMLNILHEIKSDISYKR